MLVKVKPAEGARIRQPNRSFNVMGAAGDTVNTDDVYYRRLIDNGDLVVVPEAPSPKVKKSEA